MLTKTRAIATVIDSIDENAWIPVNHPDAVRDPDTSASISDAEVTETAYIAFSSTENSVTARCACAACHRRPLPRRLVPGMAISPVLHRH